MTRAKRYGCVRCGSACELSDNAKELVAASNDAANRARERKVEQTEGFE